MSYSAELLKHKITVLVPEQVQGTTGKKTQWRKGSTVHAALDWARGTRALHQGDTTVFDTVMIRCRYTSELTKYCRILCEGKYYTIESFHADYQENTIQLTCTEKEKFEIVE